MAKSVNTIASALAKSEAKLDVLKREQFLELAREIVKNLPDQKLDDIRSAVLKATAEWTKANAKPDKRGFVYVHKVEGPMSFGSLEKVKLADCEAWRLGRHRGMVSPFSIYPELFFDFHNCLEKNVKNLILYEFFAVAIYDNWRVAHLDELMRYHSWMANSIVDWLIHLRPNGWKGVEPTASIFYAIHDDRARKEYEKLKAQKTKQTRKTKQSVVDLVTAGARSLFAKYPTWSGNRIAEELKRKDTAEVLPSGSQIRTLITRHCPEIPKQKAGRKQGQKKM
jgi:hypothetical protein